MCARAGHGGARIRVIGVVTTATPREGLGSIVAHPIWIHGLADGQRRAPTLSLGRFSGGTGGMVR